VILDRADDHQQPHPGDDPNASSRSVLTGVLQHVGAELSAHETITAEQEQWGSIAQLAAEYETIAAAAQHDRWASLVRASGLTDEQAQAAVESEAFGPLTAELRRAEANHHDIETLLPRLVAARGFDDADDIAAVLHYRPLAPLLPTATATASPGRHRSGYPPKLRRRSSTLPAPAPRSTGLRTSPRPSSPTRNARVAWEHSESDRRCSRCRSVGRGAQAARG
jgi:hypothetical protein